MEFSSKICFVFFSSCLFSLSLSLTTPCTLPTIPLTSSPFNLMSHCCPSMTLSLPRVLRNQPMIFGETTLSKQCVTGNGVGQRSPPHKCHRKLYFFEADLPASGVSLHNQDTISIEPTLAAGLSHVRPTSKIPHL